MPKDSKLTDEQMLEIMHLTENEGWNRLAVAERFGKTNGQIVGIVSRLRKEADKHPCKCRKKVNKDGGMKPRWWRR